MLLEHFPFSKGLFHSFGKYFKIKEVVMTTSTWLSTWPAINWIIPKSFSYLKCSCLLWFCKGLQCDSPAAY